MEEQEEKVVVASSGVEESRSEGPDAGFGEVGGSLTVSKEEVRVADSAGEAFGLEMEGEGDVRRPLDGGDVTESSKGVAEAEADGVGDVVGSGFGGSSVVEGTEPVSVVEEQSLEAGVVKDGAETPGPREDVPQGQIVESGAVGRLAVVGSSGGETVAAVTEKGESAISTTSILVEGSDVEARVLEGRDSSNATEECADNEGEALGRDDALKVVASSCETNLLFDENKGNKHTLTAVEGNTASVDDEDMACPNIEGMDIDAYNDKFYFSLDELQTTTETANSITENQHNALADQLLPYQPTQVLVQHEVPCSIKVLQNSEADVVTVTEQLLHENVARKATDIDQARISEEHKAAPQQLKVVADSGPVEKSSYSSLDLATSNQSAGMGNTISSVDHKVFDNAKTTDIGLKKYTRASRKSHHALLTFVKDEGPGPQLEADQSFDKDAAHGPFQVESEEDRKVESQEQVTCPEQVLSEDNHAAENLGIETVCMSSDTTQAIDRGHISLGNGKASTLGLQESAGGDDEMIIEEDFNNSAVEDIPKTGSDMVQKLTVDGQTEYDDSGEGSETEVDEQDSEPEQPNSLDKKSVRQTSVDPGTFSKGNQASFQLQPDDKGEFCVSDLVWGKVRSHPWWPGQIFDLSDASDTAIKYHKKDCFLVAYFGDRTFAWNEASLLKPFRSHFSQVEKQSNSEAFQDAVSCALDEVSRRVELGLSCPCIPAEDQERIKFQIVENTGVRPQSSIREYVDNSLGVDLFGPEKLVEYMKTLAQSPTDGADRLDLVIAKAQLLALYRSKGYSELPALQYFENEDGLQFEDEVSAQVSVESSYDWKSSHGQENFSTQRSSYHKRKHNLRDGGYLRKKETFMSESLSESWDSFDDEIDLASPSGKRRKGSEFFADDYPDERKTVSLTKVSPIPKPSFKIGECIRRIASQMTGSPSIPKSNRQPDGSIDGVGSGSDSFLPHSEDSEMKEVSTATESSSQQDLLAQLLSSAEHPIGSCSVSNIIISFFSDFRNSVVINPDDKDGRTRELAYMGGSSEMFEFEDMSDTYWTDRVIQNGSEEQLPRRGRKRQNQLVPVNADKRYRRSSSRKQHLDGNGDAAADKPFGNVDENAPAELVMHFPIVDSVPSETNLNRMFKRFGPLKESDTEVDRDTNRARVVFKKYRDAEAAYGSATKFNIFGQTLVNYHLNHSISVPFKMPTIVTTQGDEDTTLFLEC